MMASVMVMHKIGVLIYHATTVMLAIVQVTVMVTVKVQLKLIVMVTAAAVLL